MNVVVYEIDTTHPHPRAVPLAVRAAVAALMRLQDGDTVTRHMAEKIQDVSFGYVCGHTDAVFEQLNALQRGTTGSGKDDVGDAPSGLGDLPVAASHSRAAQ